MLISQTRTYRVLRHVSTIRVGEQFARLGPGGGIQFVYEVIDTPNNQPLDNDFVVTDRSANLIELDGSHHKSLDANHTTIKSQEVILDVLDQIQTDYPIN